MRPAPAPAAAALFALAIACVFPLALFACDDTPRGEQGIDYLIDGSYYSVPPGHDAGADVHPPCVDETDPNGICAKTSSAGVPASHLIVCTRGRAPTGIVCIMESDASVADAGAFCCTTGVL